MGTQKVLNIKTKQILKKIITIDVSVIINDHLHVLYNPYNISFRYMAIDYNRNVNSYHLILLLVQFLSLQHFALGKFGIFYFHVDIELFYDVSVELFY